MTDKCRERILTAIIHENDIQKGTGISGGKALISKPVKIDEQIKKINFTCRTARNHQRSTDNHPFQGNDNE